MKKIIIIISIILIAALCAYPIAHAFHHSDHDCEICAFIFNLRASYSLIAISFVLISLSIVAMVAAILYTPVFITPILNKTRLNR